MTRLALFEIIGWLFREDDRSAMVPTRRGAAGTTSANGVPTIAKTFIRG
jgi:hypothetical protein